MSSTISYPTGHAISSVWLVSDQLQALLAQVLADHFGGLQGDMAKALGLTPSPFSRALKTGKNFGPEPCFRLARLLGQPVVDVLRVAGKAQLADLVEETFGAGPSEAARADGQLGTIFGALSPQRQEQALQFMKFLRDQQLEARPPQAGRGRKVAG